MPEEGFDAVYADDARVEALSADVRGDRYQSAQMAHLDSEK